MQHAFLGATVDFGHGQVEALGGFFLISRDNGSFIMSDEGTDPVLALFIALGAAENLADAFAGRGAVGHSETFGQSFCIREAEFRRGASFVADRLQEGEEVLSRLVSLAISIFIHKVLASCFSRVFLTLGF